MEEPVGTGAAPGPLLRKRYRLIELIGRGGTASVYRGFDEALGRDVAIKMYPRTADARDAKRQEDEVNVLAGLSHHSLITLLDAGVDRSRPESPRVYIVMELVNGVDLQRTIARGLPSAQHVSQLGFDIAEALQYLHRRGVVHRDIKPANILMVDYRDDNTRARAKLTDFGIAQFSTSQVAADGVATGTAAYLSPEQVRRSEVGTASDIYSLGLVLLECFTGTLAFPGERVSAALARLDRSPDIPRAIAPRWRSLLRAMTASAPADRPSASELVTAMRDLVISETGRHLPSAPDAFDRIARLAARALAAPVAVVTVNGTDRMGFSSTLDGEFDPHALADPLAGNLLGLGLLAEVRIVTTDGRPLGALRVFSFVPHDLTTDQRATLDDLVGMVRDEITTSGSARERSG